MHHYVITTMSVFYIMEFFMSHELIFIMSIQPDLYNLYSLFTVVAHMNIIMYLYTMNLLYLLYVIHNPPTIFFWLVMTLLSNRIMYFQLWNMLTLIPK